jgi:hypothetical protein
MCIPPTHFLLPVSANFFFKFQFSIKLSRKTSSSNSGKSYNEGVLPYHCYAFRVVSPMLEIYYSRLYEEEIILISNVICPFVMRGPYISYIHVFPYASNISFSALLTWGGRHTGHYLTYNLLMMRLYPWFQVGLRTIKTTC